MTLQEKIQYVTNEAADMEEISDILKSVSRDYLSKYDSEIEKSPNNIYNNNYSQYYRWLQRGVDFFTDDIIRDNLAIWEQIPERFENTEIYQKLKFSKLYKLILSIND